MIKYEIPFPLFVEPGKSLTLYLKQIEPMTLKVC